MISDKERTVMRWEPAPDADVDTYQIWQGDTLLAELPAWVTAVEWNIDVSPPPTCTLSFAARISSRRSTV